MKTISPIDIYSKGWRDISNPTREHVVPQSLLTSQQANDLNNIFICTGRVNSLRGTLPFAMISHDEPNRKVINGTTGFPEHWTIPGGSDICIKTKDAFMPPLRARGPIARTCMYMYFQYPSIRKSVFPHVIDVETALTWHALYPVEDWEIERSKAISELGFPKNDFVLRKL